MEDYLEYIEAYFEGTPLPEETRRFEQRIAEDRDFAAQVAFYLSAKQVLKEELSKEKKEKFRELLNREDFHSQQQRRPVRKLWSYAAAAAVIAIVFLGGYMLFLKPVAPAHMADKYIRENLQTLGVKMGGNQDSLQNALRLYNDGKLQTALDQFERISQADDANFTAKRLAGIVSLRLENYEKALHYFDQLENHKELYSNPAIFYKAITLMKRNQSGDKQQAKTLLQKVVENNLEGNESASQWLKKF